MTLSVSKATWKGSAGVALTQCNHWSHYSKRLYIQSLAIPNFEHCWPLMYRLIFLEKIPNHSLRFTCSHYTSLRNGCRLLLFHRPREWNTWRGEHAREISSFALKNGACNAGHDYTGSAVSDSGRQETAGSLSKLFLFSLFPKFSFNNQHDLSCWSWIVYYMRSSQIEKAERKQ